MEQSEFHNTTDDNNLIERILSGAPTAIEGDAKACNKYVDEVIFVNKEINAHYQIRIKVECDKCSSLLDMMRHIIKSVHPLALAIPNQEQKAEIEYAKEDIQEYYDNLSQINNEISYHINFIEYLKQLKEIQNCPLLVLINFDAVKNYFQGRPDEFMKTRMFADVSSLIICSLKPIKEIEKDSCGVSYLYNQFNTYKIK